MRDLLRGAWTQARVVHAVALRETRTRFGAHQIGYLWALLEPVFWIMTFFGFFWLIGRTTPHGLELIPFLATGIIPYDLVMKTSDRVSGSIEANRALLFYPQVQTLDLALARGGLEVATFATVFIAIVGGHALFVRRLEVDDVLQVLLGMGLAGALGLALGLVLCAAGVLTNAVDRVKGPLFRPLFWISGLFFTADSLPLRVREIALWNPILHCVEFVRDGWFTAYRSEGASVEYVLVWIIGLAFAGLTLERAVRRRIQPT